MRKLLLLLPLMALVLVLGCAQSPEMDTKRQESQQKIESQIDRVDQSISEARKRAKELPDDARSRLDQRINELEVHKVTLENKLDEMKSASSDEWESFKSDVENASQDLESAFNNLQSALEEASSRI